MKNILILGAGGQIPKFLIPLLQTHSDLNLTLFGRNAASLPYDNVKKVSGDIRNQHELLSVMEGQDIVYMNFDNRDITDSVIESMIQSNVKRIIQTGVLSVYGEVSEPFSIWNSRMMGGSVAPNRGIVSLEASSLDYTYLRMTWLYDGERTDYVASPKGEPFLGAQITRNAIAHYILDLITGKRNDIKGSIGLWEPGSEYKPKPDWY